VTADPAQVLVAAVRSSAALLGAAEAAVRAEDADTDALHALGEAAVTAGRLAKLALDSGIEARLARQAEEAGELVGALITRTVNALEFPPDVAAAAFRHIRSEVDVRVALTGPPGRMSTYELDQEIGRLVDQLDEHDRREALAGFPDRLARAVGAALDPLELSDAEQGKALAAVEGFLAAEAAERAERAEARRERMERDRSPQWWTRPGARGWARSTVDGNGNGRH